MDLELTKEQYTIYCLWDRRATLNMMTYLLVENTAPWTSFPSKQGTINDYT
jgi:hypothetical protein